MNSLGQLHPRAWMLPSPQSVQAEEQPGHQREPQNEQDVAAQNTEWAMLKVEARILIAGLFQKYRAQRNSNKYGVSVTSEPKSVAESIFLILHKKKTVVPITVNNSGTITVDLSFEVTDLVQNIFKVKDCDGNTIKTIEKHTLEPGASYKMLVHFCSEHAGFFEQLLVFKFKTHQPSSDEFIIMRLLEVAHWTSIREDPPPNETKNACDETADGWKCDTPPVVLLKPVVTLHQYLMPEDIRDFKKAGRTLQRPLNWKNYSRRFHLLLHLEELQQQSALDEFFQESVKMYSHTPDVFYIEFPGATKNSLSTLSRSTVLATTLVQPGVYFKDYNKGWIHQLGPERVFMKFFDRVRNFSEGMLFRIQFTIDRIPLRVQHRAAALVYQHELEEVLFPDGTSSRPNVHLIRLEEEEGTNPEQFMAVQHIVSSTAKPAPYLVFGPPGTGKTATLVEAIRQIVRVHSSSKILVCAPSNSATDHLCEKILSIEAIGKDTVYRLYALGYNWKNIPSHKKLSCNFNPYRCQFGIPSVGRLKRYKIMITTLQNAGRLVTGGVPPGHYSYIIIDEAGQATESECIIPIAGLLDKEACQIVLAGDPKQLGPVITSRIANRYGFAKSLLERFMTDIDLYKSHETKGFNKRFVTKLLRNYRSHPAILKIPNELFYAGELQPYAPQEQITSYCKWELLPKKGFPLIFHGVAGTDQRDADSPSVYNMAEVEVLLEYLKALIKHLCKQGVKKIRPEEIGIIAPYRKQVEKIQIALQTDKDLRKENLENVVVGTVEKFQGKEFKVILVSAVRSHAKLTSERQQFSLGFVNNEKRFNVAMTRAQALLIVVGDPRVLKTDKTWNKFIRYCYQEGGYRGITNPDDDYDAEEEEDSSDDDSPLSVRSDSSTEEPESGSELT